MPRAAASPSAGFILALAVLARYVGHMSGPARWLYVLGAMVSLYLLVFVLIAQLFQKVPALRDLAPTQSEPPFVIAQGAALALFWVLTIMALRNFYPAPPRPAIERY